jgi:hypothetical protein
VRVSRYALLASLGWNDWLAIVLSIGAFLFGFAGFLFSLRADRRADRAEVLATRADERAERAQHRDEERIGRERKQAAEVYRARLDITPAGSTFTVDERRYAFKIRNTGRMAAHDVRVWLLDRADEIVSIKPQPGFVLAPDEEADQYGVTVPYEGMDAEELRFAVSWLDRAGQHTRVLELHPTY